MFKKIQLIDSISKNKYTLDNIDLNFYCCGVTAQSEMHIGHCRTFIIVDCLRRFLKFAGYNVKYGMNITDVDHKINNKINTIIGNQIKKENQICLYEDFIIYQTNNFFHNMHKLNMLPIDNFYSVSKIIPHIISFIESLIKKGYAYEKSGSIYFDTVQYGKKFGLIQMQDFPLWLAGGIKDITFSSPWKSQFGGHPAWHITCSVINNLIFGNTIHLHAGGEDLAYPHHFCECLQSNVYNDKNDTFQNFFHIAPILNNGIKMTKSLENCIGISDCYELYEPNEIRLMCILEHYSKSLEVNELFCSVKWIKYLITKFNKLKSQKYLNSFFDQNMKNNYDSVIEPLYDNFQTHTFITKIETFINKYEETKLKQFEEYVNNFIFILGLDI